MNRNTEATCGNCPFWEFKQWSPDFGECRRNPPQATEDGDDFPIVSVRVWCGEHPEFWQKEQTE